MSEVAANLKETLGRIEKSAAKWQQKKDDISLVAVSKKQPLDRVVAALEAGHRLFGENRVQEAAQKWPELKKRFDGVELRLIGPLQTNKAKDAVALFDVIETVDRSKLARILAKEMKAADKFLPVYIQVNIGEEEQKAGVLPKEADHFIAECRDEHGLNVVGLMCIPPCWRTSRPLFCSSGKNCQT